MKINIKTTVSIPGIPSEVQMESGQLSEILNLLFAKSYFAREFLDEKTGEPLLDGLVHVLLNDVNYNSLPEGTATKLHDGDTITLTLIMLGGG